MRTVIFIGLLYVGDCIAQGVEIYPSDSSGIMGKFFITIFVCVAVMDIVDFMRGKK